MTTSFFGLDQKIAFEGSDSTNPFAFRHYNPDEIVFGKRMEEQLRFAICYWHNFVWPGNDPFGGETFERPWFASQWDSTKGNAMVSTMPMFVRKVPILLKTPVIYRK